MAKRHAARSCEIRELLLFARDDPHESPQIRRGNRRSPTVGRTAPGYANTSRAIGASKEDRQVSEGQRAARREAVVLGLLTVL